MKPILIAVIATAAMVVTAYGQDFTAIDGLEGVWTPTRHQAFPFEACYDPESPYRSAIGRYQFDNDAGILRFGAEHGDQRRIGFYESSCELQAPMVNGEQIAAPANCWAEGDEFDGFVTIKAIDPQTLKVTTPVNEEPLLLSACRVDHAAIAWPQPPAKIFYGSRAGMTMTVLGAQALDTEAATIYLEHTREDARAFCVEYALDMEDTCVDAAMTDNQDLLKVIGADCQTGVFQTPYGASWIFRGKSGSTDSFAPEFSIWNVEQKSEADGSSASSYSEALEVYKALCPSTFAAVAGG